MSTFTQYLTESAKQYDYKIKVAGELDKDFANKLETALGKFDVAKLSAGKSYPYRKLHWIFHSSRTWKSRSLMRPQIIRRVCSK